MKQQALGFLAAACLFIVPAGLAPADVPAFGFDGSDDWTAWRGGIWVPYLAPVAASPDGRYVAVPRPRKGRAGGVWLYDTRTGRWSRIWGRKGIVQWLPDGDKMIVGNSWPVKIGGLAWPEDEVANVDLFLVAREGGASYLASVVRCVEWKLLPDGSAIVATRMYDWSKGGEERTEVRVYDLPSGPWRRVFVSDRIWADGVVGHHLAVRKVRGSWVLSYSIPHGGPGCWVNLRTGFATLGSVGGDPRYEFSPDGRWAVADFELHKALGWPVVDTGRVTYGKAIAPDKRKPELYPPCLWSPNSRHVISPASGESLRYKVLNTRLEKVAGGYGVGVAWVGNDRLLVMVPDEGFWRAYLRPLTGGMGKEIFRVTRRP